MPHFRIETNVKMADVEDVKGFLEEMTSTVVNTLEKPEEYVGVTLVTDCAMIFAGSCDPTAQAFLLSIGQLGELENKKHSAAIYPVLEKHLGIQSDRCYIHYIDTKPYELGFKGSTF